MAASKYVRASLELPFARLDLAEDTREAMGVSEGISEGERQKARGAERRTAPRARLVNRVIMVRDVVKENCARNSEISGCWPKEKVY